MTNNQPTSPTSTETKLRLAEAELKALRRQAEADQQQIQLLESRLAKADVDGLTERMGGIKVEAKASDNASPAGRPACYYAVAVGRNPGIYESCNEAAKQSTGFPGSVHQRFHTRKQAEEFMQSKGTPSGGSKDEAQLTARINDLQNDLSVTEAMYNSAIDKARAALENVRVLQDALEHTKADCAL